MIRRILTSITLLSLLLFMNGFSQGEAALPFLLISPYTEANGMGEASAAISTNDPLAFITNPAQLALQIHNRRISFGYNHSHFLPPFSISYRTYGGAAGLKLNEILDIPPIITAGVGYSRVYLDLGESIYTPPTGPEPPITRRSYESADLYTVSAAFDYLIRASAGLTLKKIHSNLSPIDTEQEPGTGQADINSYDVGVMLTVPLSGIASRFLNEPLRIGTALYPFMDINFGAAFNNLGDKAVVYTGAGGEDPLPRYARTGISTHIGFFYEDNKIELQPVTFKWTREANDILVRVYPPAPDGSISEKNWRYRSGIGDIHFLDEVIFGKRNPATIMKEGWELNFMEIVSIRGGKFREHYTRGNRNFNTEGFSLQFAGIAKLFAATDIPATRRSVINFILNHVDIRYHYSKYNTLEPMHPLDQTEFKSIVVAVFR